MWLPLLVWKFGFLNVEEMLVYVVGNLGLTVAYIIIWIPYFKRKTLGKAIALAVIPTCIFLLSGLLLRHWLLVLAALLFGMGHIYITYQNHADLKCISYLIWQSIGNLYNIFKKIYDKINLQTFKHNT